METDKTRTFAAATLGGLGFGLAAMYWLDPRRGRARRALVTDKLASASRGVRRSADVALRDLGNRTQGLAAEARSAIRGDSADGRRIIERVGSLLGLVASGQDGGLAMRRAWPPATRLLVGTVGTTMVGASIRGRSTLSSVVGLAGAMALVRSVSNVPARRLVGVDSERRAVDLEETVVVDAPIAEVFELWRRPENLPRFMSHVREVRKLPDGRLHWEVGGPGGLSVGWDAEMSEDAANHRITWKSVSGSRVGSEGSVQFQPLDEQRTRVQVRMSYDPPAGAIGHWVASLLGVDAARQLAEDLRRFQTSVASISG